MLLSASQLVDFLREKNVLRPRREKLGVTGSWDFLLVRADGSIERRSKPNLIVNAGYDFICDAIGKSASRPGVMSHIGVGSNNTAPAAGDTDLGAIIGTRQAATYAHTAGTKVFTMTVALGPGTCTGAIQEAGVFNASSSGIMLNRVTFSVINKGAGDTLTPTFTFTLT